MGAGRAVHVFCCCGCTCCPALSCCCWMPPAVVCLFSRVPPSLLSAAPCLYLHLCSFQRQPPFPTYIFSRHPAAPLNASAVTPYQPQGLAADLHAKCKPAAQLGMACSGGRVAPRAAFISLPVMFFWLNRQLSLAILPALPPAALSRSRRHPCHCQSPATALSISGTVWVAPMRYGLVWPQF